MSSAGEDSSLEQLRQWGWSEETAEEISIPFTLRMAAAACSGEKDCTSRTKRYCRPGSVFRLGTRRFVVTGIERHTLEYVKTVLHRREGFRSAQDFEDYWSFLHPRKGFRPEELVWVHFFVEISGVTA